ncbi:MAG: LemA family protein [Eubacteriales bacterium]|nr:LemA family protein [Eubacteriales bacterium]
MTIFILSTIMFLIPILLFIGLIAIVILYSCYVSVIKNKNALLEAKSGIDVQFRKRYDLIPNILSIAKRFMEHEKTIFTDITELRSKAMNAAPGSDEQIKLNSQMDGLLSKLMVSVENYPQLKSDQTMIQAMKTYSEVEEHIAAARRFYNSALTQLRNSVMIFPSSLFASYAADVINSAYYETDEEIRKPINAADQW